MFVTDFDRSFPDQPETVLDKIPRCAKCFKGLRYIGDEVGGYHISDGSGVPLLNLHAEYLVMSKPLQERIRTHLGAGVAIDTSKLYKQLMNFVQDVTVCE